eukprot:767329-Hanusia_phi.AAC.2
MTSRAPSAEDSRGTTGGPLGLLEREIGRASPSIVPVGVGRARFCITEPLDCRDADAAVEGSGSKGKALTN